MNRTSSSYFEPGEMPVRTEYLDPVRYSAQSALLDTVFPGFSLLSAAVYKYTRIDLSLYIPIFIGSGLLIFGTKYINTWIWEMLEKHLMSTADVRVDDEIYNMLMAWVSNQNFSLRSRRFVANTNLNSRMWFLWREFNEDGEDEDEIEYDEEENPIVVMGNKKKEKNVRFTPAFGTHYFWYKRRLLMFKRQQDTRQIGYGPASEREEISVSSFGRDPTILKDLLAECRAAFVKNDENRTVIYRGGLKPGTAEPAWTRCVSRVSRPFSTVVLDEEVKKNLLDDMRDYLHPYTRRWYSNRGIPYRRGYLLYGPPGTGKSSLSFAIAGYFKLKIYIVSLNNPAINEENLGTLFTELPKQCVVLLEDIDTAGLTHARANQTQADEVKPLVTVVAGGTAAAATPPPPPTGGKISLSALLNILDGVASQEGRVLIMTTNHIDKLDEALIRPGRVDMMVKFDLSNAEMTSTIFRGIFATLEGDIPPRDLMSKTSSGTVAQRAPSTGSKGKDKAIEEERRRVEAEREAKELQERKLVEEAKVERLGKEFAEIIPTMTFSPAEIQGYLLKHKRAPETAVREADAWVKKTLIDKMKEKERKEKEEKERLEKEAKEKEEEAKKAKEEKDEPAKSEDGA